MKTQNKTQPQGAQSPLTKLAATLCDRYSITSHDGLYNVPAYHLAKLIAESEYGKANAELLGALCDVMAEADFGDPALAAKCRAAISKAEGRT